MSVVYKAHDCEQSGTFLECDAIYGSVVRCEGCGWYWRCGRTAYTDGFHLEWKRVRWWNIRERRMIRNSDAPRLSGQVPTPPREAK